MQQPSTLAESENGFFDDPSNIVAILCVLAMFMCEAVIAVVFLKKYQHHQRIVSASA